MIKGDCVGRAGMAHTRHALGRYGQGVLRPLIDQA